MAKKTPEQISYNMKQVKNKDSVIELALRKELWNRGLHYRKNVNRITGHPDIAFIGKKIAVFVDSEFWHGYDWEARKADFKSHQEFWVPKIERNMQRDQEVNEALKEQGWTVLRFWGKEIKKNVSGCADIVERAVKGMKKYKSIDLFAGIGGIRMGFDRAFGNEIETVFVSEWDEPAQKTYLANFKEPAEIAGDITKIDEADIPEFDICLAGFPCQAFSLAGRHMGFEDDYKGTCRGTLFLDVARICEKHKPRVIFCENVKGLTIHDKGRTFKIICKTFEDLGYKVFSKILNSKDFGVPQNRERIYIVAFRNDIAPETFEFPEKTDDTKRIRDIIEKEPVPAKYYLSEVYIETLRKHKARHEAKGHGFGYEIRDWDDIAGAIVCGGMGRERNLVIDKRQTELTPTTHIKGEINKEGIRKMTPREWARLQGFPDTFELPLADVHLYKQFGNSVTVNVIEAIACEIKKVLEHT
ncbi:MAG: DNA mismatch endonuclease Vsr [Clostridia bacterium]|nr:DNA mismatch endonuclease Vsr [Clostridia bacterium]